MRWPYDSSHFLLAITVAVIGRALQFRRTVVLFRVDIECLLVVTFELETPNVK